MRYPIAILMALALCGCKKAEEPKVAPQHDIRGEVESVSTYSFQGERRTQVKRGWNIDITVAEDSFNVNYIREYADGGREEQYSFWGIKTLGEIRANPEAMAEAGYKYIYFG